MNKRSFLVSVLLAGGILASAELSANALPVAAPHDAIVHTGALSPMVEKAYWGWHRHYWHRHYWHPHPHYRHWHHWRRW